MKVKDCSPIVNDSRVDKSASLNYRCQIQSSIIHRDVIVGDLSRVISSTLEENVRINNNNLVYHSTIGRYTYTGAFDMIFMANIGSFSSISYGVTIGPPEHDYHRITTHPFLYDDSYDILEKEDILQNDKLCDGSDGFWFSKGLEIGSDVWIGCNSTILRGCKIGDGAVVGANSLVNKDVPPYAIVVGSPARIVKYRFDDKTIDRLLSLKWWEWSVEDIRKNKDMFMNCQKCHL